MSRASETRAATARPRRWTPASQLDAPPPKPGQHLRWIRNATLGADDQANMAAREREGYTPVLASDYPDWRGPKAADGTFSQGGLTLCKIDAEIAEDRTRYYEEATAGQLASVNNTMMREQDARMPTLTNTSRSSVERGRPKPAAFDE